MQTIFLSTSLSPTGWMGKKYYSIYSAFVMIDSLPVAGMHNMMCCCPLPFQHPCDIESILRNYLLFRDCSKFGARKFAGALISRIWFCPRILIVPTKNSQRTQRTELPNGLQSLLIMASPRITKKVVQLHPSAWSV